MIRRDEERHVYTVDVSHDLMPELAEGWSKPVEVCIMSAGEPLGHLEPGAVLPDDAELGFRIVDRGDLTYSREQGYPAAETRWDVDVPGMTGVTLSVSTVEDDVLATIERAARAAGLIITRSRGIEPVD